MYPVPGAGRVVAGRYRLAETIGRGAMGTVWRAWDNILDREIAVKELRVQAGLSAAEQARTHARAFREARTAARLSQPSLVTIYDVVEEDDRPWIVMELVAGPPLDQFVARNGPLSARRAAVAARHLIAGLATAHAAGVLHRDVKPSNVLLAGDERTVLTDFGIAMFQGDSGLTQTGMVMGSAGFTAPERLRGEPATPASDLWSLGATLYAAVEGRGPFDRRGGAITTMHAVIDEEPPAAPAAGALGPVISALLRRNPAERPHVVAAARMVDVALAAATADRTVQPARTAGQTGRAAVAVRWPAGLVGSVAQARSAAGVRPTGWPRSGVGRPPAPQPDPRDATATLPGGTARNRPDASSGPPTRQDHVHAGAEVTAGRRDDRPASQVRPGADNAAAPSDQATQALVDDAGHPLPDQATRALPTAATVALPDTATRAVPDTATRAPPVGGVTWSSAPRNVKTIRFRRLRDDGDQPASDPPRRRVTRRKGIALGLAALVMAVAAGVAGAVATHHDHDTRPDRATVSVHAGHGSVVAASRTHATTTSRQP